jgi:iron-sulfur cluster assembly accessory protein
VNGNLLHNFSSFPERQERRISMITVTEKAAGEIKRVISEQQMPDGTVLRIGVAGGGCSGFQYKLGFDENADLTSDHVSEQHGLRVAVDKKSDLFLDGTTVDFYDGLEKRGFTFENPNVTKSCGCGSSFSV